MTGIKDNKDGIELALRFSYIVNTLRYCGPPEASRQFVEYIKNKDNERQVRDSFSRFEGLQPYLSTIAEKTGKDVLDYDVVEAYWIGNELLNGFDDEDMKGIIRKLTRRGLPNSIGERLINNMPHGFVPHHNFNVFYVGVGQTSGKVPTTVSNMDKCRTGWGEVVYVGKDKLKVSYHPIVNDSGLLSLGDAVEKEVSYLKAMLPDVKKGDTVALHWDFAALVLGKKQAESLKKYTAQILDVVNSHARRDTS